MSDKSDSPVKPAKKGDEEAPMDSPPVKSPKEKTRVIPALTQAIQPALLKARVVTWIRNA